MPLTPYFSFVTRHRAIVLMATVALAFICLGAATRLPIEIVPDISPVEVQILTPTPLLPPEQAELAVTRPIELEMMGLPGLEEVRSLTKFGISQVSLIFADGTDPYRARQLISERLPSLTPALPAGIVPRLAPMSTGLGEIYTYALAYRPGAPAPRDQVERLAELKSEQDFTVRPMLRQVPGLADVNTTGGYNRELVVEVNPGTAASESFDLDDIALAVRRGAEIGGGSFINDGNDQLILRADARAQTPEEIGKLMLKMGWVDAPATLNLIAHVAYGVKPRTGAATLDGQEAVLGTAMMLPGENSRLVAQHVREKLEEIGHNLPPNMELRTLYDRSVLVDRILWTVTTNLIVGAALVMVVLFLFLGNLRAAFMVAVVLPLSFLIGLGLMTLLGVSGNLMSLGAIDFGLLIDGAVVLVDNILLRLGQHRAAVERPLTTDERMETIGRAAAEMAGPIICGILIITAVYVPVFGLGGVQLKMFLPMALTVIFCLLGSLFLALTFTPAMAAIGLARDQAAGDTKLVGWLKAQYRPALEKALAQRGLVLVSALLLVAGATWLFTRLGAEFVPTLEEGSLVLEMVRAPNINLDASVKMEEETEHVILTQFPEVTQAFARIGYSDITTDPQSPGEDDIYMSLKPQSEWRVVDGHRPTKDELADQIQAAINRAVPGQQMDESQPIKVRLDEMLEGVKADLAVKIFGQDYDTLMRLANEVKGRLSKLPDADDVDTETMGRTDVLEAKPTDNSGTVMGLAPSDFNRAISEAVMGVDAGRVDDGERYYPIVVRLPENLRQNLEAIKIAPIRSTVASIMVNLREAATFQRVPRLTSIVREGGERRVAVLITLHGRNPLGFVDEAKKTLAQIDFPVGYHYELAGSFRDYQKAQAQLGWILPPVLALIFCLALLTLGSARQAVLVLTAIPLAGVGGVIALAVSGLPFSITAAVGLIAVSGIAVLNCLVKIAYINQLRASGHDVLAAVTAGALQRLRPVLTTALVAGLGFVPMALATGLGAEVQRPLAVVVIGGVISSSLLTLFVTPVLYLMLETRGQAKPGERTKPVLARR